MRGVAIVVTAADGAMKHEWQQLHSLPSAIQDNFFRTILSSLTIIRDSTCAIAARNIDLLVVT